LYWSNVNGAIGAACCSISPPFVKFYSTFQFTHIFIYIKHRKCSARKLFFGAKNVGSIDWQTFPQINLAIWLLSIPNLEVD
jgi:hypothetical protein